MPGGLAGRASENCSHEETLTTPAYVLARRQPLRDDSQACIYTSIYTTVYNTVYSTVCPVITCNYLVPSETTSRRPGEKARAAGISPTTVPRGDQVLVERLAKET